MSTTEANRRTCLRQRSPTGDEPKQRFIYLGYSAAGSRWLAKESVVSLAFGMPSLSFTQISSTLGKSSVGTRSTIRGVRDNKRRRRRRREKQASKKTKKTKTKTKTKSEDPRKRSAVEVDRDLDLCKDTRLSDSPEVIDELQCQSAQRAIERLHRDERAVTAMQRASAQSGDGLLPSPWRPQDLETRALNPQWKAQ